MREKNCLEKYFPGEKAWKNFSDLFFELWDEYKQKDLLLSKLNNHKDIAAVIYGTFEEESLEWIYEKVPALDEISPIECLENEDKIKRLKTMLMRMPR